MAGRSLRAQLNQIRAWVRQGRTDAWIAHQLDVPATELREFRRRHGLSADGEPEAPEDLRDEIEAEIEAATLAAAERAEEEDEEDDEDVGDVDLDESEDLSGSDDDAESVDAEDDAPAKPRRRRRGGRGRGRARGPIQASFDHGERDGYGIWLEPSVTENATYSEHWAGHSAVEVTIEADQIIIRRSDGA